MILSAGLTPAWQQIMIFQGFRYGEVNRAAEVHWLAQGKVLNAGIAAHHLGGPSLTLATARRAAAGPDRPRVRRNWACRGGGSSPNRPPAYAPRSSTAPTGAMTELVENGKTATAGGIGRVPPRLRRRGRNGPRWQSSPVRCRRARPHRFYRELVERTPCPAVLDFRGEGLLATLDLKPLVVKPNREELAQTVGAAVGRRRPTA